jgi:hypothetical protein
MNGFKPVFAFAFHKQFMRLRVRRQAAIYTV